VRISRIVIGYVVSLTVFALAIPAAEIALGRAIDGLFGVRPPAPARGDVIVAAVAGAWGLFWMIWSWWYLFSRGRGHPTEAFGIEITPVTRQLVIGGPYAYTRNPMVFGYLFVLLAIAYLFGSLGMLVAVAVLAAIGWINIRFFEEPHLEKRFGEAYTEYQRQVPRFLPIGSRRRAKG
jgi:protein-S-isoprenylcysteine O-methyltransferase Ste14